MGSRIRVLLADDHVVLREATAELVNHQPDMVVVGQAGTGEETARLAKQLRPDVVVMDLPQAQPGSFPLAMGKQ